MSNIWIEFEANNLYLLRMYLQAIQARPEIKIYHHTKCMGAFIAEAESAILKLEKTKLELLSLRQKHPPLTVSQIKPTDLNEPVKQSEFEAFFGPLVPNYSDPVYLFSLYMMMYVTKHKNLPPHLTLDNKYCTICKESCLTSLTITGYLAIDALKVDRPHVYKKNVMNLEGEMDIITSAPKLA